MNDLPPLIEFRNVGMQFDTTVVHHDMSFSIRKGETVTLLGPSGGGKTVILRLIVGLLFATKGEVLVFGRNMNSLNEDELDAVRRRVGILFQGAALFDSLTVFENIAYSLREHGERSESKIARIVNERLDVVGLSGFGHKAPASLSGGQKKRVGLARALANSPEIMLFDEPTTGLDPTAARMIDDLIIKLRKDFSMTSIVVTHDISSARKVSDRWILIGDGIKIADGAPDTLCEESQEVNRFVTGFSAMEQ